MRLSALKRALSCATAFALLSVAIVAAPAGAADPTYDKLQALAREITFDWVKSHPLEATQVGLSDEDGQLDTPSLAGVATDLATIRRWESRLAAISLGGATLVDNAGQCMKEILVSVQRVTAIMKEIESASEEQSDGIEQVNKAVTQMDEVTQRNAALVEQAAAAAVSMREQAHGLVESVAAFQVA